MTESSNEKKKAKKQSSTAKATKPKASKTKANAVKARISVAKTYKMYVNGAFIRSERGRVLPSNESKGGFVANYPWATRKDFRNAMLAARKAQSGWAKRSAFNRSQILYRIAEMLEDRRALFEQQLSSLVGYSAQEARAEVDTAIDRMFWYAGWSDKFSQVLGGINPVAAPFFNFTVPEPTGVVAIFAPQHAPLLGILSAIAPIILSGNTCILIVENDAPTIALDFAEVLATSDVPGGVVNILTGQRDELIAHVAQHMDLNAIACFGGSDEQIKELQLKSVENVKRVKIFEDPDAADWRSESMQSLYWISPFIEWKTAWHPIGV